MKRRKTLPPVSPKTPSELRPLISAMTEIIETGEGVRGNPLDRKITMRDLLDSGIGKLKNGTRAGMPGSLASGVEPPAPSLSKPPTPEGFSAEGSFYGMITLTWDSPVDLYDNHAHTNIYRSEADNFANAQIAGRDPGMIYSDVVRSDAVDPQEPEAVKGYYYWITFTSTAGVEGPPNAPGGTYAEVIPDVRFIMQRITGEIDDGVLAQSLKSKIDLVVDPESIDGSVNSRIAAEADARRQAISGEARERAENLEQERQERIEAIESEAQDRAQGLLNEEQERVAALNKEETKRKNANESLVQTFEATFSQFDQDTQAAIQQTKTSLTNEIEATNKQLSTFTSNFDGNIADLKDRIETRANEHESLVKTVESGFAQTAEDREAAFDEERQAWSDAVDSVSQEVSTFHAEYEDKVSEITSDIKTRSTEHKALSKRVDTQYAELDGNIKAGLKEVRETETTHNQAVNKRIDSMTATYGGSIADLEGQTTTLAEKDEALSQEIDTAFAQAKDDFQAALSDERTAWTTATNALGSRVDTTQASVADNKADISETQESLASKTNAITKSLESMTARLNATPVWSSNFEPGADFDRWKTASDATIEATSTAFAGNQAAVIRYSGNSPSSTGNTHSVYAEVTETLAKGFVGKRIRVQVYARKAQNSPASSFAVAYSTAANGNSGWNYFEPGDDWAPFEFMWDMPVDSSNDVDYIGIWGDTSNSGRGVEVDLITIRPATSEEDLPAITAAINEESEARVKANKAQTKRFNEDISQLDDNIAGVKETVNTEVERLDGEVSAVSEKVDTAQSTLNGKVAAVETRMETRIEGIAYWSASFESEDLSGWKGPGSISGASDSSSGSQSALFSHSGSSDPASGGRPGKGKEIPERTAVQFAGRRVRITLDAKKPSSGAATEFAVAYSTSEVGNSGWHRFKPTGSWEQYSFLYDVPQPKNGGRDFIGVWGDTSNSGHGVLIDNLRIGVLTDEKDIPAFESMYTAKIQAGGLIGSFGLYNDSETVEAGFDVDQFWLGRTTANKVKPFILDDDIVYLDTARIRQGDIQEGQIGPITVGKLFKPDGTPVTTAAGLFRADAIDVDNLRVAEAAQFYGDVYSGTYRSGRRGWAILQNGDVEFNEGTFNGKVEFKNVQGAGTLAGRDHVWWSEVSGGGKPADNADRTSDNTAKGIKNQGGLATKDKADYVNDVVNSPFVRLGVNAYPKWKAAHQYDGAHKKGTLIFEVSGGFGGWPRDNGGVITYWSNHNRAVQVFYGNGGNEEWVREVHPSTYPNWSGFVQREIFSSADVDALQAKNGPNQAGADKTSDNEAKRIAGQGVFATRNEAWWSEIKGYNRPDDRADRTGENTSADTNKVSGRSAHTVKNEARRGNQSAYKTDNWTRPGSSLINGNKIYTGDAYVDTLQIKGQAVTIPSSYYAAGSRGISNDRWTTIASVTQNSQGAPIQFNMGFKCEASTYSRSLGGTYISNASISLQVRVVTTVGNRSLGVIQSGGESNRGGGSGASIDDVFFMSWSISGRSGNTSIRLQVRIHGTGTTSFSATVSNRSLSALGTKR